MNLVDPIADMLARIRNAHMALHKDVSIPVSRIKTAIAEILKSEGYINEFSVAEGKLNVSLKYVNGKGAISGSRKVSKPGRRVYRGTGEIKPVQNGLGISIVSTSQGVMEASLARTRGIGGEIICEVW